MNSRSLKNNDLAERLNQILSEYYRKKETSPPKLRAVKELPKDIKQLLVLPNGSHLRYALPQDLGGTPNWFRGYDLDYVRKWERKRKKHNIKVGLWTSRSNQHVIVADFDDIPQGYRDYDHLFSATQERYQDIALVTRSISNKVKIFFVLEFKEEIEMSKSISLLNLESLLNDHSFFSVIDKRVSALSITFTYPELTQRLSEFLPKMKMHKGILPVGTVLGEGGEGDNNHCIPSSRFNKSPRVSKPLPIFSGDIPSTSFEFFIRRNPQREKFIRLLLNRRGLASDGFDLGTVKIAEEIRATQKSVWKWRLELENLGLITKISSAFYPGRKAHRYVASGLLLEALQEIHKSATTRAINWLPSTIPDGEWHSTLWTVSRHFVHDKDAFFTWVKTIPGWNREDKERLSEAEDAIENQIRYAEERKSRGLSRKPSRGA